MQSEYIMKEVFMTVSAGREKLHTGNTLAGELFNYLKLILFLVTLTSITAAKTTVSIGSSPLFFATLSLKFDHCLFHFVVRHFIFNLTNNFPVNNSS